MKKFWRKLVVCVSAFLICFIVVPYTDVELNRFAELQ